MSATHSELAAPAPTTETAYPCPISPSEVIGLTKCAARSKHASLYKKYCTTCACQWRPCAACHAQGEFGPRTWIVNQETGLCSFHNEHGASAVRPVQAKYSEDLGEDRNGVLAGGIRSKAPNPEFIPKHQLKRQAFPKPSGMRGLAPREISEREHREQRAEEIATAWRKLPPNHQVILENIRLGKSVHDITEFYQVGYSQVMNQISGIKTVGAIAKSDTDRFGMMSLLGRAFAVWKERYPDWVIDLKTARIVIVQKRDRRHFR